MPRSNEDVTLSIEDFSFVGFEEHEPALQDALRQLTIRRRPPTMTMVEDALYIPAERLGPAYFEGALLTRDGQPIPPALQERRDARAGDIVLGRLTRPVPLEPTQVVDAEVVYLGWYLEHFGHFLLESTARLWALADADPSVKFVVHVRRAFEPPGVFRDMLEAFGIDPDRVLVPEVPTRFRRVLVPEPLYEMSHAAHESMPGPHRAVAERILADAEPFDQPVYLSRRLLPPHRRPTVGEHALEEILRENGFLILHTETMSFADQVRVANRYRTVLAEAGTALYLSLFALTPPSLHVLTNAIPFLDFFLVPRVIGAETSYCNCLLGDHHASTSYLPLMLHISQVTEYLDSLGLLKKKARAALAPTVDDLQAEYDELRLYSLIRHVDRDRFLEPEVEQEAIALARTSWPISWGMARYYAVRDDARTEQMVRQFSALVTNETNSDRLAYFYDNVARVPGKLAQLCSAQTMTALRAVLQSRFAIDLDALVARRQESRRAQLERASTPG